MIYYRSKGGMMFHSEPFQFSVSNWKPAGPAIPLPPTAQASFVEIAVTANRSLPWLPKFLLELVLQETPSQCSMTVWLGFLPSQPYPTAQVSFVEREAIP